MLPIFCFIMFYSQFLFNIFLKTASAAWFLRSKRQVLGSEATCQPLPWYPVPPVWDGSRSGNKMPHAPRMPGRQKNDFEVKMKKTQIEKSDFQGNLENVHVIIHQKGTLSFLPFESLISQLFIGLIMTCDQFDKGFSATLRLGSGRILQKLRTSHFAWLYTSNIIKHVYLFSNMVTAAGRQERYIFIYIYTYLQQHIGMTIWFFSKRNFDQLWKLSTYALRAKRNRSFNLQTAGFHHGHCKVPSFVAWVSDFWNVSTCDVSRMSWIRCTYIDFHLEVD